MSYPNAYCVKCGAHTDTLKKHTVLLQNNARALKGVCPACATEVYKILPKGRSFGATRVPLTEEQQKKYPDAFCVRCQEHTPTANAHTVIFENMSRAVTGSCEKCGAEVYRILSQKEGLVFAAAPVALAPVAHFSRKERQPMKAAAVHDGATTDRRATEETAIGGEAVPSQWTYMVAACMIFGIIIAFVSYSMG